jgi:hypothetical protein
MDSQSAKTGEAGGPSGYDAGKKVKGRKRHGSVDTDGRLIKVIVHPDDIQDRDGGAALLKASRASFPFVELVFADSAYAGERVANATCITVQIVRKADDQIGFKVHKTRWAWSVSLPGLDGNAASLATSSGWSPRSRPSSTRARASICSDERRVAEAIRNGLLE